jgi:hypothetical protein
LFEDNIFLLKNDELWDSLGFEQPGLDPFEQPLDIEVKVVHDEVGGEDVDVVSFEVLSEDDVADDGVVEVVLKFLDDCGLFPCILKILFNVVGELVAAVFEVFAVNVELFDFGYFLVELYNFVDTVLNDLAVDLLLADSEHFELLNFELGGELFELGTED